MPMDTKAVFSRPGIGLGVFGFVVADDVEVLKPRIRGARIPGGLDALLGRHQFDKLAELGAQKPPALLDMPDQGMRLVLRQHRNAAYAGIETIGQREVDDAELAAERYGGVCAAKR